MRGWKAKQLHCLGLNTSHVVWGGVLACWHRGVIFAIKAYCRSGFRCGTFWDARLILNNPQQFFCFPRHLIRLNLVSHGAFGEEDAENGAGNKAKPGEAGMLCKTSWKQPENTIISFSRGREEDHLRPERRSEP